MKSTTNAIELLLKQHREMEKLFSQIESSKSVEKKQSLFNHIADALAVDAAIEEHHFYPAVKEKKTEDILLESLEEHLGIKRVITDLLATKASDRTFDAKIKVLKELVAHHVEEEEEDLFPKAKKALDSEDLESLGETMKADQAKLEMGNPRNSVPGETGAAPSL